MFKKKKDNKNSIYIEIQARINLNKKDTGSSISCDGVCLTVEKIQKDKIIFFKILSFNFSFSNFQFFLALQILKRKFLNKIFPLSV